MAKTAIASKSSAVARQLKALRERTGLSVREVAEKLKRPPSSYQWYEDEYKKEFLPMDLVSKLLPIFEPHGVEPMELLALAGVKSTDTLFDIDARARAQRMAGLSDVDAMAPYETSKIVDVEGEAYASLVRWDMRLSAGHGAIAPGTPEKLNRVLFRLEWIKRVTATPIEHLIVLDIDGDSMEPTLRSGDNALVDRRQSLPKRRDGIYALNRDGELQVKRVAAHPVSNLLTITSDNPHYPSWPDINPDDVEIVGRLIWIGRAL
jgi:hypothetical protein